MSKYLKQQYIGPDSITSEIVFEIDTINKCNFDCPYCEMQNNEWNPNNDRDDWGKTQDILKLIPFFEKFPWPFRIHLLGGEPTLHKDISQFIDEIVLIPNSSIKLFTNGSNIKKLKELALSPCAKKLMVTISIHVEDYKMEYFKEFIDNELHTKFLQTKFLFILHEPNIHFFWYKNFIEKVKLYNIELDMYLPFDENGEYKATLDDFANAETLSFLAEESIMIDGKPLNHLMVYQERNTLPQIKDCYKNLWLINYQGKFHQDTSHHIYELEEAMANYNLFKFRVTRCSSPCWCPANNYYTKIRITK